MLMVEQGDDGGCARHGDGAWNWPRASSSGQRSNREAATFMSSYLSFMLGL
jgi:hypothetical protein